MYQTAPSTYGCLTCDQCDPRDIGSPQNFTVTPSLGNGDQLFTFSWDPPATSTCPVSPLTYSLAYDNVNWFSEDVTTTTIDRGPYSDGSHTVWIRVTDDVGRMSQSPYPSVTFEVDATGPEAPTVDICQ
jgi:hypothetical protein